MDKSDTGSFINPPSSTANPELYMAYLDAMQTLNKPKTLSQIKAEGEIKLRIGAIWLVGVVSGILLSGGMLSFFFKPDNWKDLWVIIGPIITAAVMGLIAFLTGEKIGKNK